MIIEPDKLSDYIWINGDFIKWEDAKVHLLTHSLHYAGAAWEGIRSYKGQIFKLTEHMQRLLDSASMMKLKHNYSLDQLNLAATELLKKNQLDYSYIRPLIFRGAKAMGLVSLEELNNVIIMALPSKHDFRPAKSINISSWRKPTPNSLPPQAKSSAHYAMSIVICQEAQIAGDFEDSLVLDFEDYITECTTSNIFFARGTEIVTPIADRFLDGITRKTVIEIANNIGLKVNEVRLKLQDIETEGYDSCFVTGTACEIQAISDIDLGNKKITFSNNALIRTLQQEFANLVGKY